MANLEELVIQLSADTKDLQAQLKASVSATQSATEQMAKAVDEFSKSSTESTGFFQNAMATMTGFIGGQVVIGAFNAVKDAVIGLATTMVVDGVAAAIAQQDAQNQLNNALARSGNYSDQAAKALSDFAGELQRTTKYEDDAILSASALIESMAQLDQNGLKKATGAAVDLAAAFNIDLDTASRAIAKGINGSTESLKKFGISVQEGSSKAETAANVFRALEKVSGAAAAQAGTYSGQLAMLGNNFGEVKEGIGSAIINNQTLISVMTAVNGVIDDVIKSISDNSDALKEFVANGILITIGALQGLVQFADLTARAFRVIVSTLEQTGRAMFAVSEAIAQTLSGKPLEAIETLKTQFVQGAKAMDEAINKDTFLSPVARALDSIGNAAVDGFAKMKTGADTAAPSVKNVKDKVVELTAAQKAQIEAGNKLTDQLNEQSLNAEEAYKAQLDLLNMNLEEKNVTEEDYWAQRTELQNQRYADELARIDAANAAAGGSDAKYQTAKAQLEKNQIELSKKAALEKQKFDETQQKQQIQNLQSTFSTISTLSTAHNRGLAAIGKAAAITSATIDGVVAVQKALAAAPPPFNFALAALVGVAAAANVAKISGVQLASGIDSVPGVGRGDRFPALLEAGERVVPRETNRDLKAFLESGGGGQPTGPIVIELSMKGSLGEIIEATLIERENLNISLRGAA